MLVDPDRGTVDHDQFAIESGADGGQKPVPYASFAPTHETVVARRVWPIALRDIRPGAACAKPPQYPIDHPTIINTRNTAHLVRQQRLDHRPLEILRGDNYDGRLSGNYDGR